METLFTIDRKDYTNDMPVNERQCVRAVIRKNGKIIVQRSESGEYKLPGGGVEDGESEVSTLIREIMEETGLTMVTGSEKGIGEVLEIRRDVFDLSSIYRNHTYFYECSVEDGQKDLSLTPEEEAKGYTAVWETVENIIRKNDTLQQEYWRRRDTLFLKWCLEHKIFS